jgi:hypothetical protein
MVYNSVLCVLIAERVTESVDTTGMCVSYPRPTHLDRLKGFILKRLIQVKQQHNVQTVAGRSHYLIDTIHIDVDVSTFTCSLISEIKSLTMTTR